MTKINDYIFNFRKHIFCVNNLNEIEGDIRDYNTSCGYRTVHIPLRLISEVRVIDGNIVIKTISEEIVMEVPPVIGHDIEQQDFMKWIIEARCIYRDKLECLQPIG